MKESHEDSRFLTFWRGRGWICQITYLRCCCWRLAYVFLFLTSCHFCVRRLTFPPSGHICQSWSTIADIWFIGWQGIIDRLATSADRWRIITVILFRWTLDTSKEYYGTAWRTGLILYLIIGCPIIFIQGHAIQIGRFAEDMLLPFRLPLDERDSSKRCNLPIS